MKDIDHDTLLGQHLSGEPPQDAFRDKVLRDSTAEFVRVQRRRSVLRRAGLAAAAVLVAAVAFLGGRLSAPRTLPMNVDASLQATAVPEIPQGESKGVRVPDDLVAWLDAARLFGQLGMEERMARAVERASRLLPYDTGTASAPAEQTYAADRLIENQRKVIEPMESPDLRPSAQSTNRILARIFGD